VGSDFETTALVDEAMKRSGLVWLRWSDPPRTQAFWHSWLEGRAYLLTGAGEQPDPNLSEDERVEVIVRSKDNAQRLVAFSASATRLEPRDDDWKAATSSLASTRLNLADSTHAPQRWATDEATTIYRLAPDEQLLQRPGSYPDESGRATPVRTPATTAGKPPWALHRRGTSGRPLS
jgi:hypothetical protein